MDKKLAEIIWVEASGAFFIPFGTTMGTGMAAFGLWPGWWKFLIMLIASGVAGYSGLKSFLSTSASDAKEDLATSRPLETLNLPPSPPKPVDTIPPKKND